MLKTLTYKATIPTGQYENLLVEASSEVIENDLDGARQELLQEIAVAYRTAGKDAPFTIPKDGEQPAVAISNPRKEITTFTGETVYFDELEHKYYNEKGEKLISASEYAEQFGKPFNSEFMSSRCEKPWGVPALDIQSIWEDNGILSQLFGTALHKAIEIYIKHGANGDKITAAQVASGKVEAGSPNYVLPNNTYLRNAVEQLFKLPVMEGELLPEVFLSSLKNKMAGQTDILAVTGPEVYRIKDIKTGKPIDKDKLKVYQAQLSFYGQMLVDAGRKVEQTGDIIHFDGEKWTVHEVELTEVKL